MSLFFYANEKRNARLEKFVKIRWSHEKRSMFDCMKIFTQFHFGWWTFYAFYFIACFRLLWFDVHLSSVWHEIKVVIDLKIAESIYFRVFVHSRYEDENKKWKITTKNRIEIQWQSDLSTTSNETRLHHRTLFIRRLNNFRLSLSVDRPADISSISTRIDECEMFPLFLAHRQSSDLWINWVLSDHFTLICSLFSISRNYKLKLKSILIDREDFFFIEIERKNVVAHSGHTSDVKRQNKKSFNKKTMDKLLISFSILLFQLKENERKNVVCETQNYNVRERKINAIDGFFMDLFHSTVRQISMRREEKDKNVRWKSTEKRTCQMLVNRSMILITTRESCISENGKTRKISTFFYCL